MVLYGGDIIEDFKSRDQETLSKPAELTNFLEDYRKNYHLTSLEFYGSDGRLVAHASDVPSGTFPPFPPEWFKENQDEEIPWEFSMETESGGLTRLCWPVWKDDDLYGPSAYIVITRLSQDSIHTRVEEVRQGLAKYRVALAIQKPFRVTQMTSLAGVTLLAVFLSIWIGSHLASSLAGPVTELVEGTKRVAKGDWDFILTPVHHSGEMAHLVTAFNQMTSDLRESYMELDRRRRFVETVLRQVSSGVMVLTMDGHPLSFNQAGLEMLGLTTEEALAEEAPEAVMTLAGSTAGYKPNEHLYLELGERALILIVTRAALKNEDGQDMGWLITFDDVSELEKAQRLAAWREVARRIAHEVKNPLTPISLAAQRLRRRFSEKLAPSDPDGIFDECTAIIIRQVESMRKLVNEFSEFARLPEIRPRPADLLKVIEETIALFRQANPGMQFLVDIVDRPEKFIFDPEQIGRVVTNLLTNAASATHRRGRVELKIAIDSLTGLSLTVSDDGPGLPPEIRSRIFEPYVTTDSQGHGLGLSIVRTIISDHGGFIRVTDNQPQGTSFILTIPYLLP